MVTQLSENMMVLKQISMSLVLLGAVPLTLIAQESQRPIANEQIDSTTFLQHVQESHQIRENRRLTEEEFLKMAQEPNTIVLDARSRDRFQQMHIKGAKSLSFTDFTEQTLAEVIPSKDTRILIYCNNNIENSPIAFATKIAPASLNLSTFTSLYSYGYKNVFELGPIIDPKTSKLEFSGSLVSSQ